MSVSKILIKVKFVCVFAVVFLCGVGVFAKNDDFIYSKDRRTVKIGYYGHKNFQQIDSEGYHSGYGYDYINEIAQYAGWDFEYIHGNITESLEMLETGEIDIIVGIMRTPYDEDRFWFIEDSCFNTQYEMYAREDEDRLMFEDFKAFNGINVGVIDRNQQTHYFEQYEQKYGFSSNIVNFTNQIELEEALENKEIDAVFVSNVINNDNKKIIAQFDTIPLYIAVSKESQQVYEELKKTLEYIKNNDPYFNQFLYNKYFYHDSIGKPAFTKEELEYINNRTEPINLYYYPERAPIEYTDDETGEYKGITAEVIQSVADYTKLRFNFIPVKSIEEGIKIAQQNNDYEAIMFFPHDYGWAEKYNMNITNSFITSPIVRISKKSKKTTKEDGSIAMPIGYFSTSRIEKIFGSDKITYYNNVKECIDSVRSGDTDYTYINSYTANYYLSNIGYSDLSVASFASFGEDICIASFKDGDITLVSILNKAIRCISNNDMNEIVLRNTMVFIEPTIEDFFYTNPKDSFSILGGVFVVIVSALIFVIVVKTKSGKKIMRLLKEVTLSRERFRIGMEHIHCLIFEYDVKQDKVFLHNSKNFTDKDKKSDENNNYSYTERLFGKRIASPYDKKISEVFERIKNGSEYEECVIKYKNEDDEEKWSKISLTTVFDETGKSIRAIGTEEDISEIKNTEARFCEEENYKMAVLHESAAVLNVNLSKQKILSVYIDGKSVTTKDDNRAYSMENLSTIIKKTFVDDRKIVLQNLSPDLLISRFKNGERTFSFGFRAKITEDDSDLEYRWYEAKIDLLYDVNKEDICLFGYFKNVDDIRKRELSLLELSKRDNLTGLLNRSCIESSISEFLKNVQNKDKVSAFIMMDIDKFKSVNDTLGHLAGDKLLIRVSEILRRSFNSSDIVGRMGGDEFAVFVKNYPDKNSLIHKVEKFCSEISQLNVEKICSDDLSQNNVYTKSEESETNKKVNIGASIGVAFISDIIKAYHIPKEVSPDFEIIYKCADSALYKAKQTGRSKAMVWENVSEESTK